MRTSILRMMPFLLLAGAMSVNAQVNTASLSGLATDPNGAALPHVTVVAKDQDTGYTRTVKTDDAGAYSMQDLPIGQYQITVSDSGFATLAGAADADGGAAGARGFPPAGGLDAADGECGSRRRRCSRPTMRRWAQVIGSVTIEQTPLALRNWDDLLRVVPGVQIARFTQQSGATSAGRWATST